MVMAMAMASSAEDAKGVLRLLEPQWNHGMIAASIAISLLGAFTSTQLMCQARASVGLRAVFVWSLLASLTFGFCSIWGLHFVAMLAYELDILIGIDVSLTILSSILAVVFTFAALATDMLWATYLKDRKRSYNGRGRRRGNSGSKNQLRENGADSDFRPLLSQTQDDDEYSTPMPNTESTQYESQLDGNRDLESNAPFQDNDRFDDRDPSPLDETSPPQIKAPRMLTVESSMATLVPESDRNELNTYHDNSSHTGFTDDSTHSVSGRSNSLVGSSSTTTFGLSGIVNMAYRSTAPAKNIFLSTAEALYLGCTWKNIIKGFLWSLAITSMHYSGILALKVPRGNCTLHLPLVVFSAVISWAVCVIGCILMAQMETHLAQQLLFSIVATTGVAAMHFTGMRAATFWSRSPPTEMRGYPPALATAIVSIAIATCIVANGLLAHAATVSRNKLAEIVWTRKRLWRTIAQKENAEAAAAARSDFIASASHEIRTPLHHLQGYSDLLSQTELTEEGRLLLCAIQRATKTLSLITNNVLDWSKLERDSEAICRPVALDIRTVCESILVLLPNKDDEAEVEIMVVVTPNVPKSIFLDETYIHRILMNLLSNALKFTQTGYILLLVEMINGRLVATVKDTGPGVPPSFLPQLFEPFKQAQTRGSQRGTGLGLSIVKQLLHKMHGTISVDSKHPDFEDVAPSESGSTFKIEIPVQTGSPIIEINLSNTLPKIAILHSGNERSLEGLTLAWQKFGFDVSICSKYADLTGTDWKYVWADYPFLKSNTECLGKLTKQKKWLVLVPYDTFNTLNEIESLEGARNLVPLPRPLVWHSFLQRIAAKQQEPTKSELNSSRVVRFKSTVDIVGKEEGIKEKLSNTKNQTILLVEDNPINQKLGQKMLLSLGYKALLAENGQVAVDLMLQGTEEVDLILMDQSMPLKDGVTATREIRELEEEGRIGYLATNGTETDHLGVGIQGLDGEVGRRRRRIRVPIIAVTAAVSSQAQAMFKDAGADDFLAKPLSLAKLEQTLGGHLLGKWR